jgi:hypothetical protein
MKVALVGSAASSAGDAPWKDKSWQIWGLAWRAQAMKRYDLMFEMHRRPRWESRMPQPAYRDALAAMKCPVVMPDMQADIPPCVEFPWDWCMEKFDRQYFASSVSYMVAYALYKEATEISTFGVDMLTDSEYAIQRPNSEWWLGIAEGMGVKVTVAPGSALLKANHRYGVDQLPGEGAIDQIHLDSRIKHLEAKKEEHKQSSMMIEGALREVKVLLELEKLESEFALERVAFYEAQRDQHTQALWVHEGGRQEAVATLDYLKNFQRGGVVPGDKQKALEGGDAKVNGGSPAGGAAQGSTAEVTRPRRKPAPRAKAGAVAASKRLPAKKN